VPAIFRYRPKSSYFKLLTNFLRSGKRCLGFSNYIERKHVFVNLVGGIKLLAIRKVFGGSIADALRCWRAGTGKNLQCRASVSPDLLKQLQPILYSPFVMKLVKQNTKGCAILNSLSTTLTLDCFQS
jgi:hypothetical protein